MLLGKNAIPCSICALAVIHSTQELSWESHSNGYSVNPGEDICSPLKEQVSLVMSVLEITTLVLSKRASLIILLFFCHSFNKLFKYHWFFPHQRYGRKAQLCLDLCWCNFGKEQANLLTAASRQRISPTFHF